MKPAFLILTLYVVQLPFSLGRLWNASANCPSECLCYITSRHNIERPQTQQTNNVLPTDEELISNSRESLKSGLCVLNAKTELKTFFTSLPTDLQALTLMQAPDVQNLTLTRQHFSNFPELKKVFLQGHAVNQLLALTEDAFTNLSDTLESITCQFVLLLQNNPKADVENGSKESTDVTDKVWEMSTVASLTFEEEIDIIPYEDFVKQKQEHNTSQTTIILDYEDDNLATFANFPHLTHLKLYNCSIPSTLLLDNLTNLRVLTIEYSDLQVLPDVFNSQNLTNLLNVSLPGNNLIEFQAAELQGLKNVRFLDLSANNITHLSEMSFPPLLHLEVLDLRHNPLENVFPNSFEPLNALTRLYLSHAHGQLTIYPHAFQGLSSLHCLSLEGLRLDVLDSSLWEGLDNLRQLILRGNVPRIEADALSDLTNLQKLDMRNCQLNHLSMDSFQGLKYLQVLDLSNNELAEVPPGIFEPMASLRELWLHHNRLAHLPVKIFAKMSAKLIRLEHNPWHCSCTAGFQHWKPTSINKVLDHGLCLPHVSNTSLCKEKTRYKYDKRVAPKCASPEKFHGWDIFDALRKGLKCNKSKLPVSKTRNGLDEEWADILARTEELEKLLQDHEQMDETNSDFEESHRDTTEPDFEPELEELVEDELWEPEEVGELSNEIPEASPAQAVSTGSFGFDVSQPTKDLQQQEQATEDTRAAIKAEVKQQSTVYGATNLGELVKKIPAAWFQPNLSKKSLKLLMEETKDKMKDALLFKKKGKEF